MLLALEGKNKIGFIDDSCKRSNTNEVLGKQWDRVNAIVLGWILNSISEELLLGSSSGFTDEQMATLISLIKDNKAGKNMHANMAENEVIVTFDENRCYFLNQDLNLKNVLKIGEQCEGLYYYNENVNDLTKSRSDSSSSSVSGSNINTVDFSVDSENDADSSDNFVATQNEKVATLEENIFSKGYLDQNPSSSQSVQNVKRSSRQSVFPKNYNDFVVESKVKYGLEKYDPDHVTRISKLDISDPLHFHPIDTTALIVVSIILKGTENYQVWSCAMLLALEGKNKIDFIDGTCKRSNTDEIIDDSYMQIRSFILSREVLPDVRSAYATISSEESHVVAAGSIVDSSQRNRASAFVSNVPYRQNIQRNNQNNSSGPSRHNNLNNSRQCGVQLWLSNGLTLYDVMVTPEYYVTLISVHKLAKLNKVIIVFDENRCCFFNQDLNLKNVLGIGDQCEGLYYYNNQEPALNVLKDSLQIDKKYNIGCCEICQRDKQTREPFPLSDHTSKSLGDLAHLDLWGPYKVTSYEGFRYFVTVVDDYTRAVWVYLIKSKDEIPNDDERVANDLNKGKSDSISSFKDSEVEKNNSTKVFQDVNHINFFDIEYPKIPNDDERVANDLNKGKSDSSSSSVSGSNINTTDFPVDSRNDADSSNGLVATQNEKVATLEENVFSGGNLDQNPSSSQEVQKVRRSSRQSVFSRNYNDFVVESKVKYGTEKYEMVELPKGRKAIGSKWIYKIKFMSSSEIDRYKARLVAQGFGKKEGVDYEETFSPVVKMVTVRCLLNIVVSMSWHVFQIDVNNAFLYGDLEEVVYMKPPEGYFPSNNKFMHSTLTSYLKIAFKMLRYLKSCPCLGIHIAKTSCMFLNAYSDVDWAKCIVIRKYVIGYCVFLNNSLVFWKSKKQNTLSKSSTEAKYKALASVTSEVLWILKILKDLQIKKYLPVSLHCDSNSAIKISVNPVFHERTKHFEIDLHFVREKILKGVVKIVKVDFANQIADILTKGLDTVQHLELVKRLAPRLQKEEDLRGDDLKHYEAEIEIMNLILISIPNDIYNSVDACTAAKAMWQRVEQRLIEDSYDDLFDYLQQFEKLVNASRAKKLEKSHDPLALVAHTGSSSRTSSPYYVTHPSFVVDYNDDYQRDTVQNNSNDPLTSAMILLARAITQSFSNPTNNRLRTSSNTINQAIVQGEIVNIQSKNSGNDGKNTRRLYVQKEVIESKNVQNDAENI
nr:hypothetical protein [Tanacetum cinerariifolium]